MRGIQFLTDDRGKKTAAIVDLKEHNELWAAVIAESDPPSDLQFVVDEQHQRIAVVLDFSKHGEIWEEIYDSLLAEERLEDPTEPWEEVKQVLLAKGEVSV